MRISVAILSLPLVLLAACTNSNDADPSTTTSTQVSFAATTTIPTETSEILPDTTTTPNRNYGPYVTPVSQRPTGEPGSDDVNQHAVGFIAGFGSFKLAFGAEPPVLSEIYFGIPEPDIPELYVEAAAGDLFEIDGWVFEVDTVGPDILVLNYWPPEDS